MRVLYLALLFCLLLAQSGCHVLFKTLSVGKPSPLDTTMLPRMLITQAPNPVSLPKAQQDITLPPLDHWVVGVPLDSAQSPEDFLAQHGTKAFIIIQNDTVVYEKYFNGFKPHEELLLFSITKTVVATLVGVAMREGKIQSLEQPVADFLPDVPHTTANGEVLRLQHLINMTSGLNQDDYKRLDKTLTLLYTRNTDDYCIRQTKFWYQPGQHFAYKGIDTQLLGWVVEKALDNPIPNLIEQYLWHPLGAQFNAHISTDVPGGRAKMAGGFQARPIDIAKLGLLYLKKGMWLGTQLLPESWTTVPQSRDTTAGNWMGYRHSFWQLTANINLFKEQPKDFFASGFGGQIIYVNPETNTVIVRVGERAKGLNWWYYFSVLSRKPTGPRDHMIDAAYAAPYVGQYINPNAPSQEYTVWYQDGRIWANGPGFENPLFYYPEPSQSFVSFLPDSHLMFDLPEGAPQATRLILDIYNTETLLVRKPDIAADSR